jgi:MFS family permease
MHRGWLATRAGALQEREFRLLFVGQTLSQAGSAILPIALIFAVLEFGSASALGIVSAALIVPNLCLMLFGGVWADRLPRQKVMLYADLVRAASQAVAAFLLIAGGAAVWNFALLAALYGTANAFFNPASTGLVPDTVSAGRLQQANALMSISRTSTAVLGPAIGGALVALVGTNATVLWILLPFVVLFAGFAPAAISFAAGQAAFTLVLLILFNIIAPEGWRIGLVRIEDVLLGCGVSLCVGLLFWPRGAAAALGKALAAAYLDSARHLAAAVRLGVDHAPPAGEAVRAAAAARRLDDTFHTYLAERGSKPVALSEVTILVTGVVGLRLAGDAVLELWRRDGDPEGDRSAARQELLASSYRITGWYDAFAAALTGRGDVPEPLPPDPSADGRLVAAVGNGLENQTAVRLIWTGDHLDAARRLQGTLTEPARAMA